MVQVQYFCIIIVNIFFPIQIFQDTLPGNFKAVSSHFEVLSHSYFVLLLKTGKTLKPSVLGIGRIRMLGCKLQEAKGNSRLQWTMQMKHFDLQ